VKNGAFAIQSGRVFLRRSLKTSLPAQIGTFSIEFFTRGSTPSPRYQLANAVAAGKTNKQSQERQQS
jgi:hypothetical protein